MQSTRSKLNSFLSFNLSSSHLAETICLFLIIYLALFIAAFLVGQTLNLHFATETQGKASVISNMFVWSATLFAPLAALLLINSWKIQKKYEVQKEVSMTFLNSILNIVSLAEELHSLCTEFQSPKDIKEFGKEIEKRSNKLAIDYLEMIKDMKSNNNLHKGLFVKDTDPPLISQDHFIELHNIFDLYFENIENKFKSIDQKTETKADSEIEKMTENQNDKAKKKTIDKSQLTTISKIVRPAINHLKSRILP